MNAPEIEFTHTETKALSSEVATLAVAASGTMLVLAVFSAAVSTVAETVRALGGGISGETWTLSAMSLGLATALLLVGELADATGRRRTLMASAAGLAVASVLGAVATTAPVLVAGRILQGIAGAGIVAASLGLIGHAFPAGKARTHATGVWGAAVGGGIAIGPLAGACLMTALGWRSSYWLEAVLALALAAGATRLPESRSSVPRRLDVPGALALAGGVAALTAGLIEGRRDWGGPATLIPLLGGVGLLIAFALIELRREQPMLELRLLRQPAFAASISGALFTGVAVIGLMSYSLPVMQSSFHASASASAAVLASWSATSMLVALVARRLPAAIASHARLATGLALAGAGELLLALLGGSSAAAGLIPGFAIAGVGSGVANAALGRLAVESVPHDRAAMGSGANNTARYLGGAAGVALVVALASGAGARHTVAGWDRAAIVSAAVCALGAAIAGWCRPRPAGG